MLYGRVYMVYSFSYILTTLLWMLSLTFQFSFNPKRTSFSLTIFSKFLNNSLETMELCLYPYRFSLLHFMGLLILTLLGMKYCKYFLLAATATLVMDHLPDDIAVIFIYQDQGLHE